MVIDSWDYPYNGTVVSTRRFVKALQGKFKFSVFCTPNANLADEANGASKRVDKNKVNFPRLSLPGFNHIIEAMKAPLAKPDKRLINKMLAESALLHVQYPFFLGFNAIQEAKHLKLPIICSFHSQPENLLMSLGLKSPLLAKFLYQFFIHYFYRHADLVLAPSKFAAGLLEEHGLTKPVEVLSNGVPMRFLEVERSPGRNASADTKFRILSVGRFAGEKHQDLILKAVSKSRFKDKITLTLVGTGPKEKDLKRLAINLDMKVQIGSVDDECLLSLYSSADLFVHAGEIELEGMSVMEAMAAGNAVLVSDSSDSAASTLVQDKTALFSNGSVLDLVSKIDSLLADANLRSMQAFANREWARNYSHETSVLQLSRIYQRLISKGEPIVKINDLDDEI